MIELDIIEQFHPQVVTFDEGMSSLEGFAGRAMSRPAVYDTYDEAHEAGIEKAHALIVLGAGTVEVSVMKRTLVRRRPSPTALAQSSD